MCGRPILTSVNYRHMFRGRNTILFFTWLLLMLMFGNHCSLFYYANVSSLNYTQQRTQKNSNLWMNYFALFHFIKDIFGDKPAGSKRHEIFWAVRWKLGCRPRLVVMISSVGGGSHAWSSLYTGPPPALSEDHSAISSRNAAGSPPVAGRQLPTFEIRSEMRHQLLDVSWVQVFKHCHKYCRANVRVQAVVTAT